MASPRCARRSAVSLDIAIGSARLAMGSETQQRWWLDDAEERNREHPTSFFIPPADVRRGLQIGDQVKLVFRFEPVTSASAERMWVEVTAVNEGRYTGELLNQPVHIEALAPGSVIEFGPEHVAAIAVTEEEVGYDVDAMAIVSRRIRDDDAWPHWVYRTPPSEREEDARDSGWQLYAYEDDDDFVETPGNLLLWELGWIADKFPPIVPLLQSGEEAGEWWWDEEAGCYRRRV